MRTNRVLITGGCSGLGQSLALRYVAAGYHVTVADIADQSATPVGCDYVYFNCAQPNFDWLGSAQSFDTVVCNAGISNSEDFMGTDAELDSHLMRTNALGHIALVRELLKAQKIQQDGRLAFVLSATQFMPFPIAIGYAASKAALDGFAHAIAAYVWGQGISVTRIYPGPINTPHAQKYYAGYQQNKGANVDAVALRIFHGVQKRRAKVLPDKAASFFWLASRCAPQSMVYFAWRKFCFKP
jgi:NAD(P)-dependent dehydrogenase (short-subunit alcohol dehydrogenase family)